MTRLLSSRLVRTAAFFLFVVSLMFLLALPPFPASAAADDDIPGVPLGVGAPHTDRVTATDRHDVFAIYLTEGEEVNIVCMPEGPDSAKGRLHFLVPEVPSLAASSGYEEVRGNLASGMYVTTYFDIDYMAAKSGTYHLWVEWTEGELDYEISVTRTGWPAITSPDSDDIYGIPMGPGSYEGIVDTFVDRNDVYAVKLFSGQEVRLRLEPIASMKLSGATAYLYLLGPTSKTVKTSDHHTIASASAVKSKYPDLFKVAELEYTPTSTGIYYIWVKAGSIGANVPYRLTVSGTAERPPDAPPLSFSDVPEGHGYADAIYDLASRGIILGYTDGRFGPSDPVVRQQFAKMIVLSLALPVSEADVCPFGDVDVSGPSSLYPDNYVAVCATHNITKGTAQGKFSPWANISRAQVITMVVRAIEALYPGVLANPPAETWSVWGNFDPTHAPTAAKAQHNGLLDGLPIATLSVWSSMPRGEVAQILHNLIALLE